VDLPEINLKIARNKIKAIEITIKRIRILLRIKVELLDLFIFIF
jgi:hypothetical protein